jgi:hypothetical protein
MPTLPELAGHTAPPRTGEEAFVRRYPSVPEARQGGECSSDIADPWVTPDRDITCACGQQVLQ